MNPGYAAIKGKIGTTEYYLITMKAADAVRFVRIAGESEEWKDLDIEEKYQREINYKRVKSVIAPYLAHDENRFFGALIVDVKNPEQVVFQGLDKSIGELPIYMSNICNNLGVIYFQGEQILEPLDGQHRLKALDFAMSGIDEKGKPIPGLRANSDVGTDDITLILVMHEDQKARMIFNKVNRYAKATTKADNLITSDDDICAKIARKVANEQVGVALVNWKSNTITRSAPFFTTLNTIYESTKYYLEEVTHQSKISDATLPDLEVQEKLTEDAIDLWQTLLSEVDLFKSAVAEKEVQEENDPRMRLREEESCLLMKPVVQLVLIQAYSRVISRNESEGADSVVKRINKINWSHDNSIWENVLVEGDKVITGKQKISLAARILSRMLGDKLDDIEEKKLIEDFRNRFPESQRESVSLPEVVT